METTLEKIPGDQRLIKPNSQREVLLEKLNSFNTDNFNKKEVKKLHKLIKDTKCAFILLCWNKVGTSQDDLKKLNKEELEELASLIYERTIIPGLLQSLFLAVIPIFGWMPLCFSLIKLNNDRYFYLEKKCTLYWKNMRYFWWYRRIKKISGKDFVPDLGVTQDS